LASRSDRSGADERMKPTFIILEHPSDLGIEARGKSISEAFSAAAEGLISVICDPSTIKVTAWRDVAVTADDREQLCVRWLSEILYLYDGEGFLPRVFEIDAISDVSLAARIGGESFDQTRHIARQDVKAVTYHQLEVRSTPEETIIKVFLDI
jgi:SHS2 domain-containing protein